ncbi:hypothetical protein V1509DRAFT_203828 [Lipomyces kononenkoae]
MAQSALSVALSALSARELVDEANSLSASSSLTRSRTTASSPEIAPTSARGSAMASMYASSFRRQSASSISPKMVPVAAGAFDSGSSRPPLAGTFRGPIPSSSFPSSSNASVPVSPNMFPFSPPMSGVRVLRDRRRRGSSVVTTTILSPYDGELMFSSSFDEHQLQMNEDNNDDDRDDMNDDYDDMDDMDVDEMDLDYKSDTDEEDWQSAGVESLRRGNAFHLMAKDAPSSSSSSSDSGFSASSRDSVSSAGTADTKLSVYSHSVPAVAIMKPTTSRGQSQPAKSFGMHMDVNRQEREADAIQALVQLRSL